jgi:hypothetical protein
MESSPRYRYRLNRASDMPTMTTAVEGIAAAAARSGSQRVVPVLTPSTPFASPQVFSRSIASSDSAFPQVSTI